ncbi:alginate export family protein [Burkholderia ubonensis]|uniref:alginate export family protein n=1 Tax=Burkholderia ubonensis TaxID=101571 RepID=UPI002ABE88D6|nr:alginate export family protein [Burkholderia ubonensis]
MNRTLRNLATAVVCSGVQAIALGTDDLPLARDVAGSPERSATAVAMKPAAAITLASAGPALAPSIDATATPPADPVSTWATLPLQSADPLAMPAADPVTMPAARGPAAADSVIGPLAQFEVPSPKPGEAAAPASPPWGDAPRPRSSGGGAAAAPFVQTLTYEWAIGSESDITYRRNADLDRRLRDGSLVFGPQINGYIIYRPRPWLEMMLEMFAQKEIAVEPKFETLPNGERQRTPRRAWSLAVDQAFVTFKRLGPFEFTVGRRNFEDERHWLYDTSLDVALLRMKLGKVQTELSFGRKDWVNGDVFDPQRPTRINNTMLYVDYRGIEDVRLAAYTIYRNDRTGLDGKPLLFGARAYGMTSDRFNFWSEFAMLRGKDELNRNFRGYAFDVGTTYRFPHLPLAPAITLGYAYGSGDDGPGSSVNHEFRQTGLESNEWKMAGFTKFKYYGEVLDPELSNLQIFTVGLGLRLAPKVFLDLVYHKYRLNRIAAQIRNWALTAEMNQVDTHLSKDVGDELDVVLGLRGLFGIRRLGLDLRFGWFFPGRAFLRNEGTEESPRIRRADKGIFALAKFWW